MYALHVLFLLYTLSMTMQVIVQKPMSNNNIITIISIFVSYHMLQKRITRCFLHQIVRVEVSITKLKIMQSLIVICFEIELWISILYYLYKIYSMSDVVQLLEIICYDSLAISRNLTCLKMLFPAKSWITNLHQ